MLNRELYQQKYQNMNQSRVIFEMTILLDQILTISLEKWSL